jgi:hypothetical protein
VGPYESKTEAALATFAIHGDVATTGPQDDMTDDEKELREVVGPEEFANFMQAGLASIAASPLLFDMLGIPLPKRAP